MKKHLLLVAIVALLGFSFSQWNAPTVGVAAPVTIDDSGVEPVDVNMHDFMEGVFQGPYRRLKESMAKEPVDNAAWKQLRGDALILAEGGNLLLARLPEDGAEDWKRYSIESREAGEKIVLAAKQKNYSEAREAYIKMLDHCNSCHKQFEKGRHILTP